eukprot:COSAG01_NODE_32022_length_587_cov_2.131148_1_plen_101_part_00
MVRNFLSEIGTEAEFLLKLPTPVFCDNDTATGLAGGRRRTPNSKHIAIKYHYTRQLVKQEVIYVLRVPTDDNRADLLTKPVKPAIFARLIERLRGRGARL